MDKDWIFTSGSVNYFIELNYDHFKEGAEEMCIPCMNLSQFYRNSNKDCNKPC